MGWLELGTEMMETEFALKKKQKNNWTADDDLDLDLDLDRPTVSPIHVIRITLHAKTLGNTHSTDRRLTIEFPTHNHKEQMFCRAKFGSIFPCLCNVSVELYEVVVSRLFYATLFHPPKLI
jgi:hypothetical protein